jgi:hypothetical protein
MKLILMKRYTVAFFILLTARLAATVPGEVQQHNLIFKNVFLLGYPYVS